MNDTLRRRARYWPVLLLQIAFAGIGLAQTYEWTTVAGSHGGVGFQDGPAGTASFYRPTAVAVDPSTGHNHSIRRITPDGAVTTVAGTSGLPGFADGAQQVAKFSAPSALATGPDGSIYVADTDNCLIRKISTVGQVESVAGTLYGYDHVDGVGTTAGISYPTVLALDASGNLYVAEPDPPPSSATWSILMSPE